jgi:hypothetical protein
MTHEGPFLETLTRRLAETPPDFLAEPKIGVAGAVQVDAVLADVLRELGGGLLPENLLRKLNPSAKEAKERRKFLRLALLTGWLLADPWFRGKPLAEAATRFLAGEELQQLAQMQDAPKLVADAERREELSRLTLKALNLRPAGENEAQAQDRLATLNSAERARVIQAARAAEERARQIREEMVRKAAEEAADKWNRE